MSKEYLFVYNAKSDKLHKYLDFAHKIISPKTYACDLCSLTHGNFGEREAWTKFRKTFTKELIFLYKDQFEKEFKPEETYPVILEKNKRNEIRVLISTNELKKIKQVEELITLIQNKITVV